MRKRSVVRLALIIAVTVVGLGVGNANTLTAQSKFDISGDWVFEVQTDQGTGSPTFAFKQTGEKLTGKYKGLFGEADLTGTVTGKSVKFSFSADAQGTQVTVTYEGEIESNSSIKGKVDLGGLGAGTFTGKRTK